jgi:hypothetical protein
LLVVCFPDGVLLLLGLWNMGQNKLHISWLGNKRERKRLGSHSLLQGHTTNDLELLLGPTS